MKIDIYLCDVKVRIHVIASLWIVVAALLFSQVGAGFFHDKHDAHKGTVVLGEGEYAIQEHGEHCKLCSIDLIHLYNETPAFCLTTETHENTITLFAIAVPVVSRTFASDRAPPVA